MTHISGSKDLHISIGSISSGDLSLEQEVRLIKASLL
jgi:hypothetical protein